MRQEVIKSASPSIITLEKLKAIEEKMGLNDKKDENISELMDKSNEKYGRGKG